MNVEINTKLSGRYKIQKFKVDGDGNCIESTGELVADWFENTIVDDGLNWIGVNGTSPINTVLVQCRVGGGNTTPTESDTTLVSQIGTTTTVTSTTNGTSGSSPYYGYVRKTFRFGVGAAAGNLTEVGIFGHTGNNTMFSRSLIKNGSGDPITITVLSDEILDVTYEVRIYAPETDITYGPLSISGVDYSGTIRAANVNIADSPGGGWGLISVDGTQNSSFGLFVWWNYNQHVSLFSSDVLGSITGSISGTEYSASSCTTSSYTIGNFYNDYELLWDLEDGNIAGGAGSLYLPTMIGAYQMNFTPKIPKDATYRLKLNIRISWGRYAP